MKNTKSPLLLGKTALKSKTVSGTYTFGPVTENPNPENYKMQIFQQDMDRGHTHNFRICWCLTYEPSVILGLC